MTNPIDLAKTLEGLSSAADKEADDIRYYSGGSDYNASLAKFHNALTEAYRTGKMVVVPDDAVERMARALAVADGIEICSDAIYALSSYGHRATAALAALKGADHAG